MRTLCMLLFVPLTLCLFIGCLPEERDGSLIDLIDPVDDPPPAQEDFCPDDPNKIDPGLCGCGVPDFDSDGDGEPDCLDECPDDPNKIEPGACGCGEPDRDLDGDGEADCLLQPIDPSLRYRIRPFDNDEDAAAGFAPCYTAAGRLSNIAADHEAPFTLTLHANTAAPQGGQNTRWENGVEHEFSLNWNGQQAVFSVDEVVLWSAFSCEPIAAVQLRCQAAGGSVGISELTLNGNRIGHDIAASDDDDGNGLRILRLEFAPRDELGVTGVLVILWDPDEPPGTSQLSFRIEGGSMINEEPIIDCNGNGIADEIDIHETASADCNADGVPDECQVDSDGDGLIDACDGCPEDPDKTDPGTCGCGVADTDSNGDGTPDCLDPPADPDLDCSTAYFDNDDEAGADFDQCYVAEGRIGSAAFTSNFTFELDLSADTAAPRNEHDFAWQPDQDHDFVLAWNGTDATFQVDGVVLNDQFDCTGPINAILLRCRANLGRIRIHSLAIDGVPLGDEVTASPLLPHRPLQILRLECDFPAAFVLTGKVRFWWNPILRPQNSHLAFQIAAGRVGDAPPIDDCNNNGIADDQDIAAGTSQDCDVDGVPDECQTDSDGDGVIDPCDGCPDDPYKTEPGACGCGIPDTDSDADGTPDCMDGCPDDPAKTEPGLCGCGTPDSDSDGDGVPDCDDLCPDTPPEAVVDEFGCPLLAVEAGDDLVRDEVGLVQLQPSVVGGAPPYQYEWSAPGWEGSTEESPAVMPTETTTYTLTVTDVSDPPQIASDAITVTINDHGGLSYAIIDLGSLSSNTAYPSAINDAANVVGYYFSDLYEKRAFLYSGGAMIDLGDLGGGESYARDINNAGQVVGESRDAGGQWRAFLWDSVNGMQDLGTLGGSTSTAYAINDSGDVVGYSLVGNAYHAFLYSDGAMGHLDTFDYYQSAAFDINNGNQIVGTLVSSVDYKSTGFIHADGVLTDLGAPLLQESQCWVINNAGLIAGYAWGGSEERSFLYAEGLVVDLGTLPAFPKTLAYGINDVGQVVGAATSSAGTSSHAFIYTGGQLMDLNNLLAAGHGWEELTAAFSVNNSGQITGYGRLNGEDRPFIITPQP